MFPLSSLTSKTFTSGLQVDDGSHPSLLERLQDRGEFLLTLKDFGTLLSIPAEARNAILAQLREIYDGRYDAAYGTGVEMKWKGKLGLIAAATPAVDDLYKWSAELGERFMQFRLIPPDRDLAAQKAASNQPHMEQMREELEGAYSAAYTLALNQIDSVTLPEDASTVIRSLARLVSDGRTPVRHHASGGYEIAAPEGTARLAAILDQVLHAAAICHGGDMELANVLVRRVAVDSIVPERRRLILEHVSRERSGITVEGLAGSLRCDESTVRTHFADLIAIRLLRAERPVKRIIYSASDALLSMAQEIVGGNPHDALQKLFYRGNHLPPDESEDR